QPTQPGGRGHDDRHRDDRAEEAERLHRHEPGWNGGALEIGHGEDDTADDYEHGARADEIARHHAHDTVDREPLVGREVLGGDAAEHDGQATADPGDEPHDVQEQPETGHVRL